MKTLGPKGLQNTLFKKVLLSLFPKEFTAHGISPAGMFVSFISAKQFFSLVNRKIIENYKLNLFDIALDPFEVKIGFGDKPAIKVKDVENYYAYCATANLNGFKMYNPSSMANIIAMMSSIYIKPYFASKDAIYFSHILITIYLLTFLFVSRIKVFPFPPEDREKNFNWFVDLFFSFYIYVFEKTQKKVSKKKVIAIKKEVMKEMGLFFFLFHFYQRCNEVFSVSFLSEKECFSRLFYDELQKTSEHPDLKQYMLRVGELSRESTIDPLEAVAIDLILPADLLIRYIFNSEDVMLSTEYLCGRIFDKDQCDEYLMSFLEGDAKLEEFIEVLLSSNALKNGFFDGMHKLIAYKFRNKIVPDVLGPQPNDLASSVGGMDGSDMQFASMSEHLKEESNMIEKLLNFYVTLLGGFGVSRGDTMFLRFLRPKILQDLLHGENIIGEKKGSLQYYGGLLYLYSKNVFYYKYAYDNIRAGKDKFNLPFRAALKEVYSNMFIITLFDQNFIATVLQDINPSDMKVYLKNSHIIKEFDSHFSQRIQKLINTKQKDFLEHVYAPFNNLLPENVGFMEVIKKHLTSFDISTIKSRLYTADFRIMQDMYIAMEPYKQQLQDMYGSMTIFGICAGCKDTIFGLLLSMAHIQKNAPKQHATQWLEFLLSVYVVDILNIAPELQDIFLKVIRALFEQYTTMLHQRILIDDNPVYLQFLTDNLAVFGLNKTMDDMSHDVVGEDIIWCKGFLKNCHYYNKRYILPQ